MLRALAAVAALALAATAAQAQPDPSRAIPVHMRRGTDTITLRGRLTQNGPECCAYAIAAAAGQKLYWNIDGPAVRMTIQYPDGTADGPGIPNPLPLRTTGVYILGVSPDLMADGAFGRFTLKITIPPLHR
ncbi:MAG TPA: hypothetical protein VKU90_01865 [Caulobacteraceae bacterium]|jgi:hypothetical protein|nr:hypothetical protein [Caulobacteraceae bacterium]